LREDVSINEIVDEAERGALLDDDEWLDEEDDNDDDDVRRFLRSGADMLYDILH